MSESNISVIETLVKAMVVAESSGASEIRIDDLLTALDQAFTRGGDATLIFSPIRKRDMPLSNDAINAIESIGERDTIPLSVFRDALVRAKESDLA
jgi:hypothetical protein